MKMVIDTSVLVAAVRSSRGASHALIARIPDPGFQPVLSVSLYTEWQAVLSRPEHLPPGMTADDAAAFVRYLASVAHLQDVHYLWRPFLHDPDDDMVLECAVAAGAAWIVTHNVHDFRRASDLGVRALTPAEFVTLLRSES